MYKKNENNENFEKHSFKPLISEIVNTESKKLYAERVLDIPIRITVELGRTRKSIADIQQFDYGSIITLNKNASEPVEVFANGKLVAKGETVVIGEHLGVRITEVFD